MFRLPLLAVTGITSFYMSDYRTHPNILGHLFSVTQLAYIYLRTTPSLRCVHPIR